MSANMYFSDVETSSQPVNAPRLVCAAVSRRSRVRETVAGRPPPPPPVVLSIRARLDTFFVRYSDSLESSIKSVPKKTM